MQQLEERTQVELDGVTEVEISLVAGDLAISETDGQFRLDGEVVEGPPLEIEAVGSRVEVRHRDRDRGLLGGFLGRSPRAIVRMQVPVGTRVRARVVSAQVLVDGLTGSAAVQTVSGSITGTAVVGGLEARTVSGDVELQRVEGRLQAQTVSGDVTVSDGALDRLSVKTVSGDLIADLVVADAARVEAVTISGNVLLRVPEETPVVLESRTISGDLRCDLPLQVEHADRRRLDGRTAGGGDGHDDHGRRTRLELRTTSGDIAVLGR